MCQTDSYGSNDFRLPLIHLIRIVVGHCLCPKTHHFHFEQQSKYIHEFGGIRNGQLNWNMFSWQIVIKILISKPVSILGGKASSGVGLRTTDLSTHLNLKHTVVILHIWHHYYIMPCLFRLFQCHFEIRVCTCQLNPNNVLGHWLQITFHIHLSISSYYPCPNLS